MTLALVVESATHTFVADQDHTGREKESSEMSQANRRALIQRLQDARGGRLLVTYYTSTRAGHEIQIADDVLRLLYEHLEAGQEAAQKGVDLMVHSNGGSGTVPWRVVSLIREYTKSFAVLVPHRAFSAATLIALGADEIVMHRMGCLGPIDPSVTNAFNPAHPLSPGQLAPISVEDVSAYFRLVQDEIGITHEDELVQALTALTEKVHPLALGNVQRSHNQSRMMARKLLKKHLPADREHEINQIIDNLKSNLFFHGHPINRDEAQRDLNLKVQVPPHQVEQLMWDLYVEYERELLLKEPFNPLHELDRRGSAPATVPPTSAELIKQLAANAQAGLGVAPGQEEMMVKIAAAMLPITTGGRRSNKIKLERILGAVVESVKRTDLFLTDLTIERSTISTPAGPQDIVKQEVLWQRWEESDGQQEAGQVTG